MGVPTLISINIHYHDCKCVSLCVCVRMGVSGCVFISTPPPLFFFSHISIFSLSLLIVFQVCLSFILSTLIFFHLLFWYSWHPPQSFLFIQSVQNNTNDERKKHFFRNNRALRVTNQSFSLFFCSTSITIAKKMCTSSNTSSHLKIF